MGFVSKGKREMRFSIWIAANLGIGFFGIKVLALFLVTLLRGSGDDIGIFAIATAAILALCVLALRFLHTRVRLV